MPQVRCPWCHMGVKAKSVYNGPVLGSKVMHQTGDGSFVDCFEDLAAKRKSMVGMCMLTEERQPVKVKAKVEVEEYDYSGVFVGDRELDEEFEKLLAVPRAQEPKWVGCPRCMGMGHFSRSKQQDQDGVCDLCRGYRRVCQEECRWCGRPAQEQYLGVLRYCGHERCRALMVEAVKKVSPGYQPAGRGWNEPGRRGYVPTLAELEFQWD